MEFFGVDSPELHERVISRNELAFSFLTNIPIVPGHVLICPIRVVPTCDDLSSDEWKCIMNMQQHVCGALKQALGAEGFNFAWNMGEAAGQNIHHFHLHVVPRKRGDTGILQYEPRSFLYRQESPQKELEEVARLIKTKCQHGQESCFHQPS